MALQTHIDVQFSEISIMQMNINYPFPLEQLMRIRAYDDNNTDLTKYLNILSNHINYRVPGDYTVPVFLQANNQIINQVEVLVHILSPDQASQVLPRIEKDTNDIYVQQTDLPHPYKLVDFITIRALDSQNNDITRNIVLNMSQVNYSHAGDYVVIIKAPDARGNIAISTFHLHVLTEEQVEQMENADEDPSYVADDEQAQLPTQYAPNSKTRRPPRNYVQPKKKNSVATDDDDDDDSHAKYWLIIKKYWWVYVILGIVIFTVWDMFG